MQHRRILLATLAILLSFSNHLAAEEVVRIGGTGMGTLLIEHLIDDYRKTHPDAQIKAMQPPLGSSGGLRALAAQAIDIVVVAARRDLPPALDDPANTRRLPWVTTPFVFTGHDLGHTPSLTLEQVADIYRGHTVEWPDGKPVRLITRTEREFDTHALRAMSPGMNEAISIATQRKGIPFAENDVVNEQLLESVPASFGAVGLGQLLLAASPLKPLAINGVRPTPENLLNGSYPYEKPLYLVFAKTPSAAASAFLAYLQSPRILKSLAQQGFVPISK